MFHKRNKSTIESDEGFVVFMGSDSKIIYQEGGRTVSIDIEILGRPIGALLYISSMKKWEPDGQLLNESQRNAVVANVSSALEFAGYVCRIQ